MAKKTDLFANKFYGSVVESAANTLTFAEIQTNVDVFSKKAWVLHKLEWYFGPTGFNYLDAADDVISAALVSSNKMDALTLDDAGVIDLLELNINFITGVGFSVLELPISRSFADMPGGGLIIAPRPLYLAVKGTSLAGAVTMSARGYFTAMDLNADEYLELVDFYRIVQ